VVPTYQTRIHALDPTCADVRIEFDDLPMGVEVRGRLMGPRCPGVSTVEVAYQLRRLGPEFPDTYQVLIPEPNLWAPEHPFRYEGPVEFWRNGEMVGKMTVSLGLRS
jgi:Glycosyl hydrolases family 2